MRVTPTRLQEVLVVEPEVHRDARGWFLESFSSGRYAQLGLPERFVQDNVSYSRRRVLRGLHLQYPHGQGKLVCVLEGAVFDVAVDVRVGSPHFGCWVGELLSADNARQLWIPPGFAHGFCVVGESAVFVYKCTEVYHRDHELGVRWDDPDLAIAWPERNPVLSPKDGALPRLVDIPREALPVYGG